MVKAKAITQAEVDAREAREEQERINAEAEAYLKSTDWYIIRKADSGKEIPGDIVVLRQQARDRIVRE